MTHTTSQWSAFRAQHPGHLDFAARVESVRLETGATPRVAPSAACLVLWERARAEGLPVRTLYVVTVRLAPGTTGQCNLHTGDIWVWQPPDAPEAAASHLLHELAELALGQQPRATLDEDWAAEAAACRRARELAVRWGCANLYRQRDLARDLQTIAQQRAAHGEAALLAGSPDPQVARSAYAAILWLGVRRGWPTDLVREALRGPTGAPDVDEALVAFDRSVLRLIVPRGPGDGLGTLAWPSQPRAAATLRYGLQRVAKHALGGTSPWAAVPVNPDTRPERLPLLSPAPRPRQSVWSQMAWGRLQSETDLITVLAYANHALLDYPDGYVVAGWFCYGDTPDTPAPVTHTGKASSGQYNDLAAASAARLTLRRTRLYRLIVDYADPDQAAPAATLPRSPGTTPTASNGQAPPGRRQLWIRADPLHQQACRLEAALQLFLKGWSPATGIMRGTLSQGLESLFAEHLPPTPLDL